MKRSRERIKSVYDLREIEMRPMPMAEPQTTMAETEATLTNGADPVSRTLATTELLECILSYLPPKDLLLSRRTCLFWWAAVSGSQPLSQRLFLKPLPATKAYILQCEVRGRRDHYSGQMRLIPEPPRIVQAVDVVQLSDNVVPDQYGHTLAAIPNPWIFEDRDHQAYDEVLHRDQFLLARLRTGRFTTSADDRAQFGELLLLDHRISTHKDLLRLRQDSRRDMFLTQPPCVEVEVTVTDFPDDDAGPQGTRSGPEKFIVEVRDEEGVRLGRVLDALMYHYADGHGSWRTCWMKLRGVLCLTEGDRAMLGE